ncbi:MAG: hypothetical protein ACP5IA_10425, partial [Sediminispirochaetaceae bacterium]
QTGRVGDVEVKEKLSAAINSFLDPLRERRQSYSEKPGLVEEVIFEGTLAAREEARLTLLEMKKAMGLTGVWNRISRGAEKARKRREKQQQVQVQQQETAG